MARRSPRQIGTFAETAVTRYALEHGFPRADRRVLRGRQDAADVLLCPGVVIEVKGGNKARLAGDALIGRWLDETELEVGNARADVGFLVVQRANVGPARAGLWWAWWRLGWLAQMDGEYLAVAADMPVRCTLADSLELLLAVGYPGRAA